MLHARSRRSGPCRESCQLSRSWHGSGHGDICADTDHDHNNHHREQCRYECAMCANITDGQNTSTTVGNKVYNDFVAFEDGSPFGMQCKLSYPLCVDITIK